MKRSKLWKDKRIFKSLDSTVRKTTAMPTKSNKDLEKNLQASSRWEQEFSE